MNPKPQIQYRNTDLDLVSPHPLDALGAEMTAQNLNGYVTHGDDGLWYAMFEDWNADEPEPNIVKLLNALDRLSPEATQVLRQCHKIEFDIGYDCGDEPRCFQQGVSYGTLRRIVEHSASLRLTIYPFVADDDPRVRRFHMTSEDPESGAA